MRKLKIIILGPAHPIRPGGITSFNERLCQALLDEGHDCRIWSFSLQYPSWLFPGKSQFTDAPPPAGIPIESRINSVNPINWWRVGSDLRREAPDMVIVRYWIPFMGPCLGSILRIARKGIGEIVCIADNVIPHEKRPGDKVFTRWFVGAVDRFVVMSRQVLTDLKQFSDKPVQELPHPLYDHFGEPMPVGEARRVIREQYLYPVTAQQRVLLFFGLIRAYKGLDLLMEALGRLSDRKDWLLMVAGEPYEAMEPYELQAKKLNLTDRIIWHTRFVANDEVGRFFCAADAVVQPYRSATQSGVTPVAYHFGIPVIVTNVGGLPEMVVPGQTGEICEPDAASLANAITVFLNKPASAYSSGLREMRERLGWPAFVRALLNPQS